MKICFFKTLLITFLIIFNFSCNRPNCNNKNSIFDKYSPNEKEYKDELVRQLEKIDKSKLTYWMDTYHENNKTKYMNVHIQGEALCAKMVLTIDESKKGIEAILKNNSISYSGAELKDLQFSIKQDSMITEFVFQEISEIVD